MTLGKTYTLQAPDSSSSVDILDPRKLLDWTDAECNALLRKGIFAPATYGRIRFHHRSTQEYLTAQWLNRLLQKGCPRSEIFSLLFTEIYGVKVVIPSLKPIVAWLALYQDDIRDEILKRDPLILIQYGDPGSISIEARCRLLESYAKLHKTGDIANDSLDHRALWMFSHADLSETIRKVWNYYNYSDFRGDLIRLIREGAITACCDLVVQVAEDEDTNDYHRIIAVQALNACNNTTSLSAIADKLVQSASSTSARVASGFATELFPNYLDVDQLIALITDTLPPIRDSIQGFAYALEELWLQCPVESKKCFIGRLAGLALSQPVCEYRSISERYGFLAGSFEPIARQIIIDLNTNEPINELVQFLMAIERAEHSYSSHELKPPLTELVQNNPEVQRALFWADVADKIEKEGVKEYLIQYWHFHPNGRALWKLTENDLSWLYLDLEKRVSLYYKRIVLNAIVSILALNNWLCHR